MFWMEKKNNLDLEGCINYYSIGFCGELTKDDVEITTYENGDIFVIKKGGKRGDTFRFNKENGMYYESKISALMVNVNNSILQNNLQKAVQFIKDINYILDNEVEPHQVVREVFYSGEYILKELKMNKIELSSDETIEENKYYYRTYYNGVLYVEKLTRGAVIEGFEYLKHKMRMGYGCTPPYANY